MQFDVEQSDARRAPPADDRSRAVSEYRTRGVYYFDGRVACPLAGVGTRGTYASNRLALENDDSQVTIDRDAARITIFNEHRYPHKTLVADLLFLATGTTVKGERTPFALHLEVFKTGDTLSLDFHRHLRVQDRLVGAVFEPFEVVVTDGATEQVVYNRQRALDLVCNPPLTHLVIKALMAMRDNLHGVTQDPRTPGFRVADLSMGFGREPLSWMMVRACLASLSGTNAALLERGSLADMLHDGAWELSLTAFTERYLDEVVKRDLFLFGLEDVPLLRRVRARGLARGQSMSFRFQGGSGEIVLGTETAPLPNALDVARDYLEFHMLGGLLAEHAETRARS